LAPLFIKKGYLISGNFFKRKRDILKEKRDIFLMPHALQAHSKKTTKIVKLGKEAKYHIII
jgi:hypothetical protein